MRAWVVECAQSRKPLKPEGPPPSNSEVLPLVKLSISSNLALARPERSELDLVD
jgi:hypothetical protein